MNEPGRELEIEVFRAGDYGPKGAYGEAELEAIASGYDPQRHEAPVTLDHAREGPAHGWVRGVRRIGQRLLARVGGLSAALREALQSGRYKKCSVELYRRFEGADGPYLKAVSFLGAAVPEVKGLEPPILPASSPVFRESEEPAGNIAAHPREIAPPAAGNQPLEAEGGSQLGAPENVVALSESEAAAPAASAEPSPASPSPASISAAAIERIRAAIEERRRSGCIPPAWRRLGIEEFAAALIPLDQQRIFVENAKDSKNLSPLEWFLEFLSALPPQIPFGEFAHGCEENIHLENREVTAEGLGVPRPSPRAALCPKSIELHQRAVRFQSEHPGCAYAEALRAIARF